VRLTVCAHAHTSATSHVRGQRTTLHNVTLFIFLSLLSTAITTTQTVVGQCGCLFVRLLIVVLMNVNDGEFNEFCTGNGWNLLDRRVVNVLAVKAINSNGIVQHQCTRMFQTPVYMYMCGMFLKCSTLLSLCKFYLLF
jgi:hypothetical protein